MGFAAGVYGGSLIAEDRGLESTLNCRSLGKKGPSVAYLPSKIPVALLLLLLQHKHKVNFIRIYFSFTVVAFFLNYGVLSGRAILVPLGSYSCLRMLLVVCNVYNLDFCGAFCRTFIILFSESEYKLN